MSCEICGWAAAFCSMLGFGSFGVPIKSKRVMSVDIDPLVFQSYKTFMCFLTCWLVLLAGVPFSFTPWGIVSGFFWVPGGVATVYAVKVSGLAIAIGAGSSCIVLVSFIWGIFIFGEEVHSEAGASFAILCMMVGLMGMAYYSSPESETTSDSQTTTIAEEDPPMPTATRVTYSELAPCDTDNTTEEDGVPVPTIPRPEKLTVSERTDCTSRCTSRSTESVEDEASGVENSGSVDRDVELVISAQENDTAPQSLTINVVGICGGAIVMAPTHVDVCACRVITLTPTHLNLCGCNISWRNTGILATMIFTGLWGGSILVPMKFCNFKGVHFLISFGIGASIATVCLWIMRIVWNALYYGSWNKALFTLPSFHLRVMWLPGGISGLLWSIGNFFSILSVYYLGEGVGYPLVQTSILVSGLWGIFYFREITGVRRIALWLVSSCSTIFGILLLSYEHVKRR